MHKLQPSAALTGDEEALHLTSTCQLPSRVRLYLRMWAPYVMA